MDFDTLHKTIPYVTGGKKHLLSYSPYNGVTLRLPGRHAEDTSPVGGDFVVCVDDEALGWVAHQFTHDDLFQQMQKIRDESEQEAQQLMLAYACIVVNGADPAKFAWDRMTEDTLHGQTFLYAVQCLAVAEHRRYHQHEAKGGGRYLPARFSSGIVEGLWTADDAKLVQRRGRLGLDALIAQKGKPTPLKEIVKEAIGV